MGGFKLRPTGQFIAKSGFRVDLLLKMAFGSALRVDLLLEVAFGSGLRVELLLRVTYGSWPMGRYICGPTGRNNCAYSFVRT